MSNREVARSSLLPVTYVEAKDALVRCHRIDECARWANKAHALKSYAKQMKDDSLANMAQRIKDRAMRRGGELLAQLKAKPGGDPKKLKGTQAPISVNKAAGAARISPDQAKDMLRVAAVDGELFETMVEAPKPATVKQLADVGTKKKPKPKPWEHSDAWIEWISAVEHLATIPKCGLVVLAARDHRMPIKRECEAAIKNLREWRKTLERANK